MVQSSKSEQNQKVKMAEIMFRFADELFQFVRQFYDRLKAFILPPEVEMPFCPSYAVCDKKSMAFYERAEVVGQKYGLSNETTESQAEIIISLAKKYDSDKKNIPEKRFMYTTDPAQDTVGGIELSLYLCAVYTRELTDEAKELFMLANEHLMRDDHIPSQVRRYLTYLQGCDVIVEYQQDGAQLLPFTAVFSVSGELGCVALLEPMLTEILSRGCSEASFAAVAKANLLSTPMFVSGLLKTLPSHALTIVNCQNGGLSGVTMPCFNDELGLPLLLMETGRGVQSPKNIIEARGKLAEAIADKDLLEVNLREKIVDVAKAIEWRSDLTQTEFLLELVPAMATKFFQITECADIKWFCILSAALHQCYEQVCKGVLVRSNHLDLIRSCNYVFSQMNLCNVDLGRVDIVAEFLNVPSIRALRCCDDLLDYCFVDEGAFRNIPITNLNVWSLCEDEGKEFKGTEFNPTVVKLCRITNEAGETQVDLALADKDLVPVIGQKFTYTTPQGGTGTVIPSTIINLLSSVADLSLYHNKGSARCTAGLPTPQQNHHLGYGGLAFANATADN